LFLPSLDILSNAQRVSRTWKNAIAQSPAIQTKLWLRPQSKEVLSPAGYTPNYPWKETIKVHSNFFFDSEIYPVYPVSVMHNSIITDKKYHFSVPLGIHPDDPSKKVPKNQRAFFGVPKKASSDVRSKRLDMYLTEPRITTAHLDILVPNNWQSVGEDPMTGSCSVHNEGKVAVHDPNGLTFGTVISVAQKLRDCMHPRIRNRDVAGASIWFVTE